MVGAIIGYFFLAVLAIVLLALCLHTVLYVDVRAGRVTLAVRVLFVKIQLYPMKPRRPRKEKPPKKQKEKPAKAKAEKPKKKRTFGEIYAFVKRIATAGMVAMGIVLRHLHIKGVVLCLPVHAEDAADTATRCGQIQAGIGALRAVLAGRLDVRFRRIEIVPDFTGQQKNRFVFSCKVAVSVGILLVAGMRGLWAFIFTPGRARRMRRKQVKAILKRRKAARQRKDSMAKAA